MYLDRLTLLRDYLLHLPAVSAERFNMEFWFTCGSASCALGHACMIPEFNKLGFGFNTGNPDADLYCPIYKDPVSGRISAAFRAGADLFGLTEKTSRYLFDGEQYDVPLHDIAPIDVADRITELMAEVRTLARLEAAA